MMLDFYTFSQLRQHPYLKHAITTKNTEHPYALSTALHTGEDASQIIQNRHTIAKVWGEKNSRFIVANQTHSDHIVVIENPETRGWEKKHNAIEDCDALITNQKEVILTILTADCVPILLYDPVEEVIAIVHAGWKGTAKEIAKKCVDQMSTRFGCKPSNIYAGIAPSIGACCYEVGEDVATHFTHLPYAYRQKETKYMLDLPTINQKQLCHAGIPQAHIEMSHLCTSCEVERFFSYRKENGCTGRFMSMIMMKGQA